MIENLKKLMVYILFLLFVYLFFKVIKIFIIPIGWALIFSIVFYPLNQFLSKKLKSERSGVLLTTLIFILIILIPITFFITKLSLEIYSFTPAVLNKLSTSGSDMEKYYLKAKKVLDDFGISLGKITNFFADKISVIVQKIFQNLFKFIFQFFFIIIFFYSFLKYKDFLLDILKKIMLFLPEKNEEFLLDIKNFTQAIFYGIFLTAIIQSLFAIIGFYLFKIPAPLFFGTLVFIFAFIPIGGSSIVWIPLSIYLILTGNIKLGIILFLWCLFFVSTLDNLIRPYLVSKKFKTNLIFIFVTIIGGLSVFGGLGIFYGPLLTYTFYKVLENINNKKGLGNPAL